MKNYLELLVKNNEWCVKGINTSYTKALELVDPELNTQIKQKFPLSDSLGFTNDNYYYYNPRIREKRLIWSSVKLNEKTLISLNEFKKYVLEMQDVEPVYEDNSHILKLLNNLSNTK